MDKLDNVTLSEFLEGLASERPELGGGSACLVGAAMGASLLSMACQVTINKLEKLNTPEGVPSLQSWAASNKDRSKQLLEYAWRDGNSYGQVIKARRLPRDTGELARQRQIAVDKALELSITIPLEAAQLCLQALEHVPDIRSMCSKVVHSDVLAGARLLYIGIQGALVNVEQNCQVYERAEQFLTTRDDIADRSRGVMERVYLQGV